MNEFVTQKAVVIHCDLWPALGQLDNEKLGQLMKAAIFYVESNCTAEPPISRKLRFEWATVKASLDKSCSIYSARVVKTRQWREQKGKRMNPRG